MVGDIFIVPYNVRSRWPGCLIKVIKELPYDQYEVKLLNKNWQSFVSYSPMVSTKGHACIKRYTVNQYVNIKDCNINQIIRIFIHD